MAGTVVVTVFDAMPEVCWHLALFRPSAPLAASAAAAGWHGHGRYMMPAMWVDTRLLMLANLYRRVCVCTGCVWCCIGVCRVCVRVCISLCVCVLCVVCCVWCVVCGVAVSVGWSLRWPILVQP